MCVEKDQLFSFRGIEFEIRHPSGEAEQATGCVSLEVRKEDWAQDVNLGSYEN